MEMETLFCLSCSFRTELLLLAVNGAPIIGQYTAGTKFDWPVDKGIILPDRQPLFGKSKTWRGLLAAIFMGAIVGILSGLSVEQGAMFALLAMLGDLLASFTKRRMHLAPSSRSRMLDVIPESMLPTAVMSTELGLAMLDIGVVVAVFFLLEVYLSPILFRWHIRKRPY